MAGSYLTTAEFAARARAPESTVRYWRMINYGPKGIRVGRRVLYSEAQVDAWFDQLNAASGDKQPAA